jgi:hypothetical protein
MEVKNGQIFNTSTLRIENCYWQHWILATFLCRPCAPSTQTLRRERTKGAQQNIIRCAPFCIELSAVAPGACGFS